MAKKSNNWLSFEEARTVIRDEKIPSRAKFFEWHDNNKPKQIPRRPNRVYRDKWIGWNDFLGNDNEFKNPIKRTWRSLSEATIFVHRLNLQSQQAWLEYLKRNKLPEDIPTRPDLVYKDWISWSHWLGSKPIAAFQAKAQAASSAIFYLVRDRNNPANVLTVGIEQGGKTGLYDRQRKKQFDILRMYQYEPEEIKKAHVIIAKMSTPWYEDEKMRVVPNVYQLMWELDCLLLIVK